MGWATQLIKSLNEGKTVQCRPRGSSMKGKIKSGEIVTIKPITKSIEVGDIVLCKVKGNEYLHLVKAIQDSRYLIGNNQGRINGWIGINSIFGLLGE